MKNGLILGLIFSLNFVLSISGNVVLGLLLYAVSALIVYQTYRFTTRYRDIECAGAISYRHALAYVVLLFLFASLISAIVKYVFFQFINPDFLPDLMNKSMEVMEQIMPSVPENAYESMETMMSPINYTLIATWVNVLLGLFVGLVIAGIVKKDKDIFD